MARITKEAIDRKLKLKARDEAKVLYSFRVKREHLDRLKRKADNQSTTVTKILETLIEQYLTP